jgi:hypothetical protein
LIIDILSSICLTTTSDDYNTRLSAFTALGKVYKMVKTGNNIKLLSHYFNNIFTAASPKFLSETAPEDPYLLRRSL